MAKHLSTTDKFEHHVQITVVLQTWKSEEGKKDKDNDRERVSTISRWLSSGTA